jgi:hypothetical protein
MTRITQDYTDEAEIWRDAWRIAEPGAANPVAVARTLFAASAFLLHEIGTDAVRKHPALRLIAAQLSSLYNVDALGGSPDDAPFINQVKSMVNKLDSFSDVCLNCGAYNDYPCRDKGARAFRLMDHDGRPHTMDRDFTDYRKVVEQ